MKKVLWSLGLALAVFAPAAHAGIGFDGCYQMYLPGSMYPAFCLEGTAEEGIGGAGVRLVIFHTNTDRVVYCGKSSGSGMTANSFEYLRDGKAELKLQNVTTKHDRKEGDAVLGHTTLKFLELDGKTADRLLSTARKDSACVNAGW